MMKFISWNVNGLRACVKPKTDDEGNVKSKGFEAYFKELDADFFCLQETKMQEGQLDLQFEGYQSYWNYAERKGIQRHGYLHTPHAAERQLRHWHRGTRPRGTSGDIGDGRLLPCVRIYSKLPRGRDKRRKATSVGLPHEMEDDFQAYLHALDEKKPVIVCGDMNVAHEEIDIKNPKTNHLSAGFTDEERGKMTTLLSNGFTDTFRALHPDDVTYSWWSYRFRSRERNTGWRIDYFLTSNRLRDRITDASIHTEIFGSDHCPIELDID